MYKTNDFDFELPQKLIATQPCTPREEAKMIICQNSVITHKKIKHLTDYFKAGDVLVFNDTKVIKAKITGYRNQAKVEVNLHKNLKNNVWQVFAKPAKRLKIGDKFTIADDFDADIIAKNPDGTVNLKFNCKPENFFDYLEKYGQVPLPPYIKREKNQPTKQDEINYQTVFAKNPGAVAAPTAGLHFTDDLLKKLKAKNIISAFVTLNVGAGTFLPVKSELIKDHQMHSEYFTIDQKNCQIINQAKKEGRRIIAIGTTSLRVLESAVGSDGFLKEQSGDTEIFIYPPYKFKIIDGLMTNFHLPKSTLFMLICAFIGKEKASQLYQKAIENNYRFYSYGDACLLL